MWLSKYVLLMIWSAGHLQKDDGMKDLIKENLNTWETQRDWESLNLKGFPQIL